MPVISKFQKFISHYTLNEVLKFEVLCLQYLNYKVVVFSPYDVLNFLLNHGVIFSDEDNELMERNKLKKIYQLNHSNKLEKLANSCTEYMELFFEDIKYLEFHSYQVAFSCIALAREKSNYPRWTTKLDLVYNVTYEEISACVDYIAE